MFVSFPILYPLFGFSTTDFLSALLFHFYWQSLPWFQNNLCWNNVCCFSAQITIIFCFNYSHVLHSLFFYCPPRKYRCISHTVLCIRFCNKISFLLYYVLCISHSYTNPCISIIEISFNPSPHAINIFLLYFKYFNNFSNACALFTFAGIISRKNGSDR